MQKQDCLLIGKIVKCHGIHGELIIETSNPEAFQDIKESIHLEVEGLLVPFFIDKKHQQSTQRFRIKFNWVDGEERALEIMNCDVYLPVNQITDDGPNIVTTPHLLIGFKAIDAKHGDIGEVVDYIDQPNNPLLVINKDRSEILIPYHQDLIDRVKKRTKTVYLDTPEGLIDLYL